MEKSKNLTVLKANELIEASYKLTTQEQRIILTMISMLDPWEEREFNTIRVYVKDFIEMIGVKGKSKYEEIIEVTKKLREKTVVIDKANSKLVVGWLSSAEYFPGKGYVELEFSPKMRPYLLQLKQYTLYNLRDVMRLKASYSVRIYELLKQYQKLRGDRYFEIVDLKETLGIDPSRYKLYGDFKRRIIQPSIKELNNKTDMTVRIEEKKKSRRVVGIKFIFSFKTDPEIENPTPDELNPTLFKKLTKYFCLSPSQSKSVMETYPEERLLKNLKYVEQKIRQEKIENIGAYTFKAIKEDYSNQPSLFEDENKEKERQSLKEDSKKKLLEKIERCFTEARKKETTKYEKKVSSEECDSIREPIEEKVREEYGNFPAADAMVKWEYEKHVANLAGFPSYEEWIEKEKLKYPDVFTD